MVDLSGGVGFGAGTLVTGSGVLSGVSFGKGRDSGVGGAKVHATNCSVRIKTKIRADLVTESDTHYVDLRGSQATSRYIQLIEIIDRPNVYAVIIATVDLCSLHARCNAMQREFSTSPIGVIVSREGPGL